MEDNILKIAHILPASQYGVLSVVRNFVLHKSTNYLQIVVLIDIGNHILPEDCDFPADVEVRFIAREKWQSRYSLYKNFEQATMDIDVIISHDGGFECAAIEYLHISKPIIYVLHGMFPYYFKIVETYGNIISKILCVSNYLRSKVETTFPSMNTETLYCPVPSIQYHERPTSNKIKLIYAGNISRWKNVMLFPLLCKKLRDLKCDFLFDIYGSGELDTELSEAMKEYREVSLKGYVDNTFLHHQFCQYDIVLLLSKGEGLSITLVEAMKAGCVPIVFDVSGMYDLIGNNERGFISAQFDIEDIANNICYLAKHRSKLHELSLKALSFAVTHFDDVKQTEKLLAECEYIHKHWRLYPHKRMTLKKYIQHALYHLPIPLEHYLLNKICPVK